MSARRERARPDRTEGVEGLVVRLHARRAEVRFPDGKTRSCTLRGGLFRETGDFTRPVAVGDRVHVAAQRRGAPVIESVLPRRTVLSRTNPTTGRHQLIAANVDQVIITVALAEPEFRPRFVDRLLVAAEREDLEPVIAFTKCDLIRDREPFEAIAAIYRDLDYRVVFLSAVTGEGVATLRAILHDRISVFAGHSGVGKSTLLNVLQPELDLATAAISDKWGKGRHTTTVVSLLPLEGAGYVVDTPGVRSFQLGGLEAWKVAQCFREMAPLAADCRFPACTHDHEPECAVKLAARDGRVDPRRYESYLRLIHGDDEDLEGLEGED